LIGGPSATSVESYPEKTGKLLVMHVACDGGHERLNDLKWRLTGSGAVSIVK